MSQLPLFPLPVSPLAHRADPPTSKAAARALKADPRRLGALQNAALNFVRLKPGATCPELAVIAREWECMGAQIDGKVHRDLEYHRQRIGRRLSELRRAGFIEARGERMGCQTWWPK
jgi:hypothetical protein